MRNRQMRMDNNGFDMIEQEGTKFIQTFRRVIIHDVPRGSLA